VKFIQKLLGKTTRSKYVGMFFPSIQRKLAAMQAYRASVEVVDSENLQKEALDPNQVKYGETVYEDMYKDDFLSKILIDLLVSYVVSGGMIVRGAPHGAIERLLETAGDLLTGIGDAFRWALICGTSFSEILWDADAAGNPICKGLRLLPTPTRFELTDEYEPVGVVWQQMTGTYEVVVDGKERSVDYVPLSRLLILRGVSLPRCLWGMSVFRPIFKPFQSRQNVQKAAEIYTKKLAIPRLMTERVMGKDGEYLQVDQAEKERYLLDMAGIEELFNVGIPDGLKTSALPLGSVQPTLMQDLIDLFARQQARGIIGSTSLIMESKYGTYAQALAQEPIMQNIISSYAKILEKELIAQVFKPYLESLGIMGSKLSIDWQLPDVSRREKMDNYVKAKNAGWRVDAGVVSMALGLPAGSVVEIAPTPPVEKLQKLSVKLRGRKWAQNRYEEMRRQDPYQSEIADRMKKQALVYFAEVGALEKINKSLSEVLTCMRLWIARQVGMVLAMRFGLPMTEELAGDIPLTMSAWLRTQDGKRLGRDYFLRYLGENENLVYASAADFQRMAAEKASKGLTPAELRAFGARFSLQRANTMSSTQFTRFLELEQDAYRRKYLPADLVPGCEFIGVEDRRQTDVCETLSGGYYRYDDPRIDEIRPPLHTGCRSMLSMVSIEEVLEDGIHFQQVDIQK